jgi:hypothetical protein
MRHALHAALATILLAAAACGAGSAPTCEDVGGHAKTVILDTDEVRKASPDQLKTVQAIGDSIALQTVKDCKDRKWDEPTRRCFMAARKSDEFDKCQGKK